MHFQFARRGPVASVARTRRHGQGSGFECFGDRLSRERNPPADWWPARPGAMPQGVCQAGTGDQSASFCVERSLLPQCHCRLPYFDSPQKLAQQTEQVPGSLILPHTITAIASMRSRKRPGRDFASLVRERSVSEDADAPRPRHLHINTTMHPMRTTPTLEPVVERLLQQEVRRNNNSMKAIINDALRRGPGARGKPPRSPRFRAAFHAFGFRPGADRERLNQVVDEMEADELAGRYGP